MNTRRFLRTYSKRVYFYLYLVPLSSTGACPRSECTGLQSIRFDVPFSPLHFFNVQKHFSSIIGNSGTLGLIFGNITTFSVPLLIDSSTYPKAFSRERKHEHAEFR